MISFEYAIEGFAYTGLPSAGLPAAGAIGAMVELSGSDGETTVKLEDSAELLKRARSGDTVAANLLLSRYAPRLRRWAHGRLPAAARALLDTDDLVQETLLRTLSHIARFENRGEAALFAYMRQALQNRIVDEMRKVVRRPASEPLGDWPTSAPSPLEETVGRETLRRYEAALARLKPEERELIVSRVELEVSYAEIAGLTGRVSADAARMAVTRALIRLAKEMADAS